MCLAESQPSNDDRHDLSTFSPSSLEFCSSSTSNFTSSANYSNAASSTTTTPTPSAAASFLDFVYKNATDFTTTSAWSSCCATRTSASISSSRPPVVPVAATIQTTFHLPRGQDLCSSTAAVELGDSKLNTDLNEKSEHGAGTFYPEEQVELQHREVLSKQKNLVHRSSAPTHTTTSLPAFRFLLRSFLALFTMLFVVNLNPQDAPALGPLLGCCLGPEEQQITYRVSNWLYELGVRPDFESWTRSTDHLHKVLQSWLSHLPSGHPLERDKASMMKMQVQAVTVRRRGFPTVCAVGFGKTKMDVQTAARLALSVEAAMAYDATNLSELDPSFQQLVSQGRLVRQQSIMASENYHGHGADLITTSSMGMLMGAGGGNNANGNGAGGKNGNGKNKNQLMSSPAPNSSNGSNTTNSGKKPYFFGDNDPRFAGKGSGMLNKGGGAGAPNTSNRLNVDEEQILPGVSRSGKHLKSPPPPGMTVNQQHQHAGNKKGSLSAARDAREFHPQGLAGAGGAAPGQQFYDPSATSTSSGSQPRASAQPFYPAGMGGGPHGHHGGAAAGEGPPASSPQGFEDAMGFHKPGSAGGMLYGGAGAAGPQPGDADGNQHGFNQYNQQYNDISINNYYIHNQVNNTVHCYNPMAGGSGAGSGDAAGAASGSYSSYSAGAQPFIPLSEQGQFSAEHYLGQAETDNLMFYDPSSEYHPGSLQHQLSGGNSDNFHDAAGGNNNDPESTEENHVGNTVLDRFCENLQNSAVTGRAPPGLNLDTAGIKSSTSEEEEQEDPHTLQVLNMFGDFGGGVSTTTTAGANKNKSGNKNKDSTASGVSRASKDHQKKAKKQKLYDQQSELSKSSYGTMSDERENTVSKAVPSFLNSITGGSYIGGTATNSKNKVKKQESTSLVTALLQAEEEDADLSPSSSDNENNDEKDNYLSSDVNKLSDEDALSSSDDDEDNTYKHSNRSSVRGRGAGVHNNFRGGGGHLRGDTRNNINSYRDVGSYNYGELEDTVDPRDLVDDTRVRRRLSRRESDEWCGADGSRSGNQQQNSNSRNNGVLPKSSPTTTGGTNNNKSSRGSKRENLNQRDSHNAKSLLMQLEQSGTNNGRKAYGSNSGKKERGGYNNHGGGISAGAFGGNIADNLHYGPGSSPLEDGSSYAAPHQRHGNINNRPGYELNYDYENNNYDNEQELNNYNYNPNKLSGVKKHTSAKGMNNNNKQGTTRGSTNNSNKPNNSYNNWEEQSQASSAFSGNRNNKMQHRGGNGNAAGGGPLQEMNNFEESNWARESVDREMQDWMTQNNLQHLRNAAATGSVSASAAAAAAAVVVGQDYAFPSTAEMPFFTYADAIKEKQRAAEAAGEKPKLVIAPAPSSSSANNAPPVSAVGQVAPAKSGPPTRAPPKQQAAAGVVTTTSSSGAVGPPSRLAPPPAISPPTAENVPSLSGLPVVKQTSKTAVIMSTTSGASSSGSASYEEVAIGSAHASAQQKLEKKQIILEDGRVLDTLEVMRSQATATYADIELEALTSAAFVEQEQKRMKEQHQQNGGAAASTSKSTNNKNGDHKKNPNTSGSSSTSTANKATSKKEEVMNDARGGGSSPSLLGQLISEQENIEEESTAHLERELNMALPLPPSRSQMLDVIRENKVEVAPPMDLSRFLHDPVQLYGRSNAYQKKLDQYGPDYSSYCRVELFRAKNNDREGPASSKETTTAKEMLKQTVGKQTGKTRSVGGSTRGAAAPQVEDGSGSGPPSETGSRKPSTESALRGGNTAANGKNSTSSAAMLRRGDKKLSNTSGKTNSSTGINSSSEQRPQSISKKEERKMKQKERDLQIADNRVALEKSSLLTLAIRFFLEKPPQWFWPFVLGILLCYILSEPGEDEPAETRDVVRQGSWRKYN